MCDSGAGRKAPWVMTVKVKICGITTVEDALMAAEAGADAIGLNLVGGPRRIDLPQAERILDVLPPLVTPVALVSVADSPTGEMNEQVMEMLATRWVSTLQVYGDLTGQILARFLWEGFRVILPVPVRDAGFAATGLPAWGTPEPEAGPAGRTGANLTASEVPVGRRPVAILLDTHDPQKAGGTGRSFAWSWVREARERGELKDWPPIMLAGGLTPDNVAEAIAEARPFAVDVSSGVESSPGRKDPEKVRRFVAKAKDQD